MDTISVAIVAGVVAVDTIVSMIWQLWRYCVHCSVEGPGPLGWADSRLHDGSLDPLVETRNAALDRSWEAASTICAMLVAHDKMLEGDLKALDRMMKVIESQDRYRGFGHPGGQRRTPSARMTAGFGSL